MALSKFHLSVMTTGTSDKNLDRAFGSFLPVFMPVRISLILLRPLCAIAPIKFETSQVTGFLRDVKIPITDMQEPEVLTKRQ